VVTGGTSRLSGLIEVLEDRIFSFLPREIEKIDIISTHELDKEDHLVTYGWQGAQIVVKHLQRKDLLTKCDVESFREKLVFSFDNNENDV